MFLSYLCSVQLLSAYHKLHVFIAIYCTASLQLSWHLLEGNKMDFTPLLHIYPTSIPVCRAPFLSVAVGWWWASFNTSLIHLLLCSGTCQPLWFWCKMHHFSGLNISLEWFMSCSPNITAGKGEKSNGLNNKALFWKVFHWSIQGLQDTLPVVMLKWLKKVN